MFKTFRYSIRSLKKHPGFTAVSVLTLALGIGANTAIFSVVNAVLLRPLPYHDANRLVMIWGNFQKLNIERLPAKAAEYSDYTEQSAIFDTVAAFDNQSVNLTGSDQPERISVARVTPNLFSMLGAQPAIGRQFIANDATDHQQAVVLSYGFWQRRFGGDSRVINRVLTLDNQAYTVIGVMPREFQFPHPDLPSARPAEVWMPLLSNAEQVLQRRGPYYLNVLARLKPGVSLFTARTEMNNLAQRLERELRGYRGPNGEDGGWRITVVPLHEEIVGSSRRSLLVLFGAVVFVLLIACANVANLVLLRGARRRKELAIQCALGASRRRIVQQLFADGLVLTTLGGSLGLLVARWTIDLLAAISPGSLPRTSEINIDSRVLAFTAVTAIFSSILFGLVPAVQTSKLDLQTMLKDSSREAPGFRQRRWSDVLVVTEVAFSLLLLIGAGLLVNSFLRLQRINPGIAVDQLLTAEINLSPSRYREPDQASAFYKQLAERLESLPGIHAVSFSTTQIMRGTGHNDPFAIEGRPLNPDSPTSAAWQMVGADFFKTLGVPIVRGRDFTSQDLAPTAPGVAVINKQMATRYWPNEDPIGRRFTLGLPRPDNPWVTIVGIVNDLPHGAKDSSPAPDLYISRVPATQLNRYLFVRAAGDPVLAASAIRNQVAAIDPNQPITRFQTMHKVISETIAPRRFNTLLLGIFAGIALVLAALGTYSVISYSVESRAQEIGIRMALGARRWNVLKLVIRKGMTLALIGSLLGLVGALALTRLMSSLLFAVSPTDPFTYVLVLLCSLAVALLACYIPARHATAIDPLRALRRE